MPLTKQEKFMLITGTVVAVSIATVGIMLSKPAKATTNGKMKGYGIEVGPQCNTFAITDGNILRDRIRAIIRVQGTKGTVDPFAVATAYLKKAASHCQVYPSPPRNPGEAGLYVETFNETLDVMQSEKLLSAQEVFSFKQMIKVWGLGHGLNQEDF